jgi:hypothetical protein
MSKINFNFLRNKFFYAGLITGTAITALVFLFIISSHYPPPAKNTMTGTMTEPVWTPSVGEVGVVVASGNYCNYIYTDVTFDNDPNNSTLRCHSTVACAPGMQAVVISSNDGEFCQGGGVSVSINPAGL